MATVVEDWPTFTYTPTEEELAWERAHWEDMDRIAEYDAYVAAMAEAQEHEPNWDCDCEQCRQAQDEWRDDDREYERVIRGY